jgi:N-acetyl-beta-hexosaminidase
MNNLIFLDPRSFESIARCRFKNLTAYFIRRVHEIARRHGKTPSGWQEIFDHYGGSTAATPTPPFEGLLNDTGVPL